MSAHQVTCLYGIVLTNLFYTRYIETSQYQDKGDDLKGPVGGIFKWNAKGISWFCFKYHMIYICILLLIDGVSFVKCE